MVDGHDALRLEQLTSQRRLTRAHGGPVPDGQAAQVGRIEFGDDAHVAENGRISRMVKAFAVLESENQAAGLARVFQFRPVGAAVKGVGEGELDAAEIDRAVLSHGGGVGAQVVFGVYGANQVHMARHRAWIRLENGDHVARMVEVAVREADEVRLPRGLEFRRADGIFLEPGVDVDGLAPVGFDQKRGLTVKYQRGAHIFAMPPKWLIYLGKSINAPGTRPSFP